MMQSFYQTAPRYETKSAIQWLTQQLRLSSYHQDFDIENADANRVQEFCDFYQNQFLDPEKRFALMRLIIASYNERLVQSFPDDSLALVETIFKLLSHDYLFHFHTVIQWLCLEDIEEEPFMVTPFIRKIWLENTHPLLLATMKKTVFPKQVMDGIDQSILFDCLMSIAENGYAQLLPFLLEHHVDIHRKDYYGRTAFHVAVSCNQESLFMPLVQANSFIHTNDIWGDTPLLSAARNGNVYLLEQLLTRGANQNVSDHNGYTALHTAVERGHLHVVSYLVDKYQLIEKKTKNGETPMDIAKRHQNAAIMKILSV